MKYIIATHTSYQNGIEIHGPAHTIFNYLREMNSALIFIKHPLDPNNNKSLKIINNQDPTIYPSAVFPFLQYVYEIFINILEITRLQGKVFFIGVDPLNALSGIAARVLLRKRISIIYYIVDFTERRFQNRFVNRIYHVIDMFVCKQADQVWCVSTRIKNKKIEQGVDKGKIFFVPNSPHIRSIKPQEYNGNLNCILIAQLHDCVDFTKILEIVKITHEVIPSIRLKIIGDGKERGAFERLVSEYRLQDCIVFKGAISHEMVLAELRDAFLGFALYTNKASWNRFGDSMKAREYLSFGLPVIINTVPSTADEIREAEAGLVVENIDSHQIASFIIHVVRDKAYYMHLRQNAYHLAEKNSKELLLSNLIQDV